MNEIIEQIYTSEYVEDARGNTYKHSASSVTFEAGHLLYLYDFVPAAKPEKTLEIGMADSISHCETSFTWTRCSTSEDIWSSMTSGCLE